ncbi:MAG TPA: hypothetical protein VF337_01645 [Candidatus Limnocylindrales bacterium]
MDDARRHEGLVFAKVGRQAHSDGSEEISFITVWRDLSVLYAWLGGMDLLDTPVLNSRSPAFFEHYEVQHFESYEIDENSIEDGASTRMAAALDTRG